LIVITPQDQARLDALNMIKAILREDEATAQGILAIYTPLRFDGTPGEVAKALGEPMQKVIDFNGVLASLAVVLTQKLDGEKVLDELRDALLAKDDDS
jgi:hypothetical protein